MKALNSLCSKMTTALTMRKKENGDHLIEVLGVILIAIIVLVIFRDQVKAIVTKIFQSIANSMDTLFPPTSGA